MLGLYEYPGPSQSCAITHSLPTLQIQICCEKIPSLSGKSDKTSCVKLLTSALYRDDFSHTAVEGKPRAQMQQDGFYLELKITNLQQQLCLFPETDGCACQKRSKAVRGLTSSTARGALPPSDKLDEQNNLKVLLYLEKSLISLNIYSTPGSLSTIHV